MKTLNLKMKWTISILVMAMCSFSLYGQNLFYSLQPGTALHYKITDEDGKNAGSYILRTRDVNGTPDAGEITFVYNYFKKDGRPLFDDGNDFVMRVVAADNERSAYFESLSATMKTQDYMAKGDVSTLKPDMKPGEKVDDSYIRICVGSIVTKMNVDSREVLAVENITVPAGTFECYKLKEHQSVKFMGFGTNDYMITWYAKGIGCVRQEIYDKKGRLQQVQVLVKTEIQ